ncbi:glucose/galactose transporter WARNING [Chlamydia trachomatis]|nr:glucose/galactose transporter WARNING [Chlamydia trachomatis]
MVTKIPWFLCGVGIFHSIMWPAIFALAIEGLGRYTSKASGVLMMGCFGGALFPVIQGVLKSTIGSWNPTWLFVVLGEIFILYYALSGHKVKKTDSRLNTL